MYDILLEIILVAIGMALGGLVDISVDWLPPRLGVASPPPENSGRRWRRLLRFAVIEVAMVVSALALYHRDGFSLIAGVGLLFVAAMLAAAVMDWRHMILPDLITLPGIALGLGVIFLLRFPNWQDYLAGGAYAGGLLCVLNIAWRLILKKPAVGYGDMKLMAMVGLFVGLSRLFPIFLIACGAAVLVTAYRMIFEKATLQTSVPIGAYLAVASAGVWICG